jgi:hypothetical protein
VLRLDIYKLGNNIGTKPSPRPDGAAAASAMTVGDVASQKALLEKLAAPLARDVDILGQAENLHARLARYHTDSPTVPPLEMLADITSRFLSLQYGLPYDLSREMPDIRQSQASLAYYYMKEAPGRYRDLRGLLVDTELQATRLAERKEPERLNPQSAAGTSRYSR